MVAIAGLASSTRTDAGVHALANVFHVDVERTSKRKPGCQAKSPVRTLDELHVCEMPAWPTFPSSIDRWGRVNVEEKSCIGLISEGEVSFENPHVPMKGKMALSQGKPCEPEKPELPCQIEDKSSNVKGVFESGHRRQHHCYIVTARARSFEYRRKRGIINRTGQDRTGVGRRSYFSFGYVFLVSGSAPDQGYIAIYINQSDLLRLNKGFSVSVKRLRDYRVF
eukprot:Gb_15898 [translate_table: standard]